MAANTLRQEPTNSKLRAIILNNTALYVLAYLLVHLLVQGTQILIAYQYRIHSIWNLSKLDFLIPDPDWRRSAVILTYGVGQTLCLVIGMMAFFWLQQLNEARGLRKVFAAWLALHAFNQFFGAMAADNFLHEGFWYAPRWLWWHSNIPVIGLGFLFANLCLVIGYRMSLPFLKTCDSQSLMKLDNRTLLVWTLIGFPWILGTLLIEALKFPRMTWLEHSHQLSMLLLLVPLAIGVQFQMYDITVSRPRATRVIWKVVLLALAALLTFRAIFQKGKRIDPIGWPEHRTGLD